MIFDIEVSGCRGWFHYVIHFSFSRGRISARSVRTHYVYEPMKLKRGRGRYFVLMETHTDGSEADFICTLYIL